MGSLDRVRFQLGSEKFKSEYRKMIAKSREKAVSQINGEIRQFSTLYILLPEIVASGLLDHLTPRNQIALFLCANLDANLRLSIDIPKELPVSDATHSSLKWVLLSGYKDNGLCDAYDQILDAAASLLIRTYHDSEVLPVIARLIFERNRKGQYIHDLTWALFSSHEPMILNIIVEYLHSSNKQDMELANRLLENASDEWLSNGIPGQRQYGACSSWLRENRPYLDFTEESFQQSSEPVLFRVNLEAKYLCKKTSAQILSSAETHTQDDSDRLTAFRHMSGEEKTILAKYSNRLYTNNRQQWRRWMGYPIEKQMKIANDRFGGPR